MNEGDFGHARFPQIKKGFATTIDCYGTIKNIEDRYILFEDNDGYPYLVDKKDFEFKPQQFRNYAKI